jgi:molecular chaperone DnaJ
MDAAKGCKRDIELDRHVQCEDCNGSGARAGTQPQRCKMCQGRGQVAHQQGFFVISTTCRQCGGKGTTIADKCPTCRGSARVPKKGTVTVNIPAGIDDGQKLRLSYQGNPGPGQGTEPGDLYVHIHVQPDSRFVRDGDNLWVDAPISFAEATLGTKVQIPTPDGPETIEVARGTQPMTRHVLSGRGLPNVRGRGRGDLIVRFVVQVPTDLSSEGRELVEKLAPHVAVLRGGDGGSDEEEGHEDGAEKGSQSVFERILRGRKKK